MMTRRTTINHAVLWAFTACLVVWLLVFGVYNYGASIEDRVKPVYTNVKMTFVVVNEDSATLLFTGTKTRNCALSGANVEILKQGRWVQAQATIVDQHGEKIEIGQQRIPVGSPFVRQLRIVPAGTAARIRLEAKCHPFWMSQQTLVPVVAPVEVVFDGPPAKNNSGVAQR